MDRQIGSGLSWLIELIQNPGLSDTCTDCVISVTLIMRFGDQTKTHLWASLKTHMGKKHFQLNVNMSLSWISIWTRSKI